MYLPYGICVKEARGWMYRNLMGREGPGVYIHDVYFVGVIRAKHFKVPHRPFNSVIGGNLALGNLGVLPR